MITRYFGLPGCGKTTVAAMEVYKALRSGRWKNVYGNVAINYPGYTYIPFSYVGKYQLEDCTIIIDEAAIECGNRDYKNFAKERVEFFMTHRHYHARVVLFSQQPDGVDVKIRDLTDRMYYIKKGVLTGPWISTIYHIPYDLVWPKEQDNGENLGKIVMGYLKPSLLARLFARRIYRPKYYPYFDSWEVKQLPPLPTEETAEKGTFVPKTIPGDPRADLWLLDYFHKRVILLRLNKRLKKRQKREYRIEKRQKRNERDEKAYKRLKTPDGINVLPSGVRIHA